MSSNKSKLVKELDKININLSDEQVNQFLLYYDNLIEWNKLMNLTTITEFDDVIVKHFVDSLSITQYVDLNEVTSVIDIGTGAGFPGIPIKIAFPKLRVTLLDAVNKKVDFLDEVIENLNLSDIEAIHGRAEDVAQQIEHRECYDLAVSRAVAQVNTLAEYCMPFVKVGGRFIPYKSGEIDQELLDAEVAVNTFGGKIDKVEQFKLPNTDISRSFVFISKSSITPKQYPRKAGKPSKKPII